MPVCGTITGQPARRADRTPGQCLETTYCCWGVSARRHARTLLTRCGPLSLRGRFLHPEQFRGLGTEPAQLLMLWLVLFHPLDGLVVPLPGLLLVAELAVGHRQEEEVRAVAPLAQLHRLAQGVHRGLSLPRPVVGDTQRVPAISDGRAPVIKRVRGLLDGALGSHDRLDGVAELRVGAEIGRAT